MVLPLVAVAVTGIPFSLMEDVSKLFDADDWDPANPVDTTTLLPSPTIANNRDGVQMHEHLLLLISRRSKDNNISTNETKN